MNHIRILTLGALLMCGGVRAQQMPLSLQACTDFAVQNNINIKNAKIDVLIQQAQNDQLLAAAYPHFSGSAGFNDFVNPPVSFFPNALLRGFPGFGNLPADGYTSVPFTPKYSSSATVNASQVVFDGNVFIALQARNTVMEMAEKASALTVENVKYNVFKAYNSLVIAYRQFAILKSSLAYARSIEHDISLVQKNGFAEKIDVQRTTVQINNLTTDSIRIANLLTMSEQLLKYQMGMDINTPIVLTDTVLDLRRKETAALLGEEKNYDRVPAYDLLQTQLKLNDFNIRRFKLSAYPSVAAVGNLGYNYSANDFSDMTKGSNYVFSSMIGLQLNVPIYSGKLRLNQLREANLNLEKTKNSIENMKQTIDFQVASSRTNLQNVVLQLRSQSNNLALAEEVLDLARSKYKAGVGSNLEVTEAQTDLLRSQTNYFSTMLDLVNAEADLKKALGLLR
jgi:outer membrane protein